ncbi:MAG: propanediol utilization protein, partial [Clostridia bacterium]|nr:propanediol utilization protein [Clostridia bacterium]
MEKKVLVETSARHIHLTEEAVAALYGEGATLTVKKELSQPGQFAAANDKITLVGPKGTLAVSVLGPTRKANQVELSFTDARALGLAGVPVRESGDVAGTPGLKMVGPAGEIDITEGVIIAKRHIHMTPADAEAFGITDKQ